ncbi:MAG: C45 family autoproteolytic acyltransferase/hydrolase [Atribacterota bacterium]|nr:C45 family autoproteolytic acyltransferase/hydrolase [Atribacterota bacterium]
MDKPFPFLKVEGTHFEIGQQIGSTFQSQIKKFIKIIIGTMPIAEAKKRAAVYLPSLSKHCPHLLEEVKGVADGAGITLEEALIPNLRSAIEYAGGCTAYVIDRKHTANGELLIGQNQDLPASMQDVGVVLHIAAKGEREILMWTFAGLLAYHGINDAGLGFFCNALPQPPKSSPFSAKNILPGYLPKRLMFENEDIDGVLNLFDNLKLFTTPIGVVNYVMCDKKRIASVELSENDYAVLNDSGKGFIAHTNHYLADKFNYLNQYKLPGLAMAPHEEDSMPRLARFNKLFEQQSKLLDLEDIKSIMSDHDNYPSSICRHLPETGDCVTVASIIAEPEKGRMHLCPGNPCENTFYTYEMK